jgi:hypothetical protein
MQRYMQRSLSQHLTHTTGNETIALFNAAMLSLKRKLIQEERNESNKKNKRKPNPRRNRTRKA